MGINISWVLLAYFSSTMQAIEPEYLGIERSKLEDYLKEHPMPEDPNYNEIELVSDLTNSTGFYALPYNVKQETTDFVKQLLNELT